MPPPDLTHVQFAVIEALGARERAGDEVRDALQVRGIRQSLAAFYMCMKRMEDAGLIKGRYELIDVGGYRAKERRYKVLGKGSVARSRALEWYSAERSTVPGLGIA